MRVFTPAELARFLATVDAALDARVEIVLIGGAAAALQYGVATGTGDFDTWTSVSRVLARAVARAREETGLPVPFSRSSVADGPSEFEGRLERALPDLTRLIVLVPERHDLALMKVVRGREHDLEALEQMRPPLDLPVLLARFEEEMTTAVTDLRALKANFLVLVERLFPERASDVARRLRTWDRRWLEGDRDRGP